MRATPQKGCMRQPVCHLTTEAEYFHRLDAELIESMRTRAASEQRRLRLAEAYQVNEPSILEALERLGYDSDTVLALVLVPLVHVAWIDGSVSEVERDRIIAIAGLRGIKADTPAHQRLMGWLDQRPTDEFFQKTLSVIERIFRSLPAEESKAWREALLLCCREVAIASCSLFGWKSSICAAKRKLIRQISMGLQQNEQILT
jgi:hypothetical protein